MRGNAAEIGTSGPMMRVSHHALANRTALLTSKCAGLRRKWQNRKRQYSRPKRPSQGPHPPEFRPMPTMLLPSDPIGDPYASPARVPMSGFSVGSAGRFIIAIAFPVLPPGAQPWPAVSLLGSFLVLLVWA